MATTQDHNLSGPYKNRSNAKIQKLEAEELKKQDKDGNVVLANKIRKELFDSLGGKPSGYFRLEIKPIIDNHSFRVNLLCKSKSSDSEIIPMLYRPLSYFVISENEVLSFNPPIQSLNTKEK